jgi:hypothetical protein
MSQDSCDDEKPSEPPIDGNKETHASENHQQISAHQEGERAAVNPTVAQPHSKEDQWHSDEKANWERQIRISKWLNWITAVGVVAAVCAFVPLYIQMRAAQVTAQTAIDQLHMMQASFQTTERAWVTVKDSHIELPIATGENPVITTKLQNTGHSPALKVRLRQVYILQDKLPEGQMPKIEFMGDESLGLVGPGGFMRSTIARGEPLTEIQTTLLKSGKVSIFNLGTVTYVDIFNISHETNFCFMLRNLTHTELSPCARWNEAN